jgi:hypothetical protein
MLDLPDAYLASMLNTWSTATLRRALAFVAGILAAREGDASTAATLVNVADGLLAQRQREIAKALN